MQTSMYLILVITGIVGPKLLARSLRRPGSPVIPAAYGMCFFLLTYLLHIALFERAYGIEQAAVYALCAAGSTLLLHLESKAKQ